MKRDNATPDVKRSKLLHKLARLRGEIDREYGRLGRMVAGGSVGGTGRLNRLTNRAVRVKVKLGLRERRAVCPRCHRPKSHRHILCQACRRQLRAGGNTT